MNDNKISDEEFHNIISELDKYNEIKRGIRNSTIEKKHSKRGRTKKEDLFRNDEKISSGFNKSFRTKIDWGIEINRTCYKFRNAPPVYDL